MSMLKINQNDDKDKAWLLEHECCACAHDMGFLFDKEIQDRNEMPLKMNVLYIEIYMHT